MDSIILFLLKSVLVSGLLTAWYWLGLRNKRLHQYNRFFLLFALSASLVVPLLHFQWFTIQQSATETVSPAKYLLQVANSHSTEEQQIAGKASYPGVNLNLVMMISVLAVSLALLVALLIRVLWVISMSRKYKRTEMNGIKLIHTDLPKAPFSFLTYLFWRDTISLETDNGKMIYRHELTHIKQKHTYDKLACQVLTCIFWMNPFYWIIQKELGMIHEFIADENAINENDTDAFARMLLQTHNNGSYLVPEHQFFSSPIKRRLTMLQTTMKPKYTTLRRIAVLPILAGVVMLFSFANRKEIKLPADKADKKIVLVLDAGHGGKDEGAHCGNLKEKDLTLRIVNRMKELAPDYNIDVHLTRSSDEYPSLAERVTISNKLQPDYFISIHINSRTPDSKNVNDLGIEFLVCTSNNHPKELKDKTTMLARSIYEQTGFLRNNALDSSWISEKRIMVLRENDAPAILIELGFIENTEQMERLSDPEKSDEICAAILKGVVKASKG